MGTTATLRIATDLTTLQALVGHDDRDLVFLTAVKDFWLFDGDSTSIHDGVNVIKPGDTLITNPGRWHRVRFALEDLDFDAAVGAKQDGVEVDPTAKHFNFVGAEVEPDGEGVKVTIQDPTIDVSGDGPTSSDGVTSIHFIGAEVASSASGATITIPVPELEDATPIMEAESASFPNGRVLGTHPVAIPAESTVLPAGARAWQTLYEAPVNFSSDVPGTYLRLIGTARHFHRGTPQFTDGKIRVKVDGVLAYTSGTVGTGSDNVDSTTLDSGLQAYTKPSGVKTVTIEAEGAVSGANSSQVVLANWSLIFRTGS